MACARVLRQASTIAAQCPAQCADVLSYSGSVGDAAANILFDTASSEVFQSSRFARAANIEIKTTHSDCNIKMPDGSLSPVVGQALISIRMHQFRGQAHAFVTKLADGLDLVLGVPWLRQHQTVLHLGSGMCKFMRGNREVTLRNGVAAPASDTQPAVASEKPDLVVSAMQMRSILRKNCIRVSKTGKVKHKGGNSRTFLVSVTGWKMVNWW